MIPIRFYANATVCEYHNDFHFWVVTDTEDFGDFGQCGGGNGCSGCCFYRAGSCSDRILSLASKLSFETTDYILINEQNFPELFL